MPKRKKSTMETYWVPGVNNHKRYGRWAFAEFTDAWEIQSDFEAKVEEHFNADDRFGGGLAASTVPARWQEDPENAETQVNRSTDPSGSDAEEYPDGGVPISDAEGGAIPYARRLRAP